MFCVLQECGKNTKNPQLWGRLRLQFFCNFAAMKTLIIYGSQYGSTKRYAERLSEIFLDFTSLEKIVNLLL